jgi:hypothetical protein
MDINQDVTSRQIRQFFRDLATPPQRHYHLTPPVEPSRHLPSERKSGTNRRLILQHWHCAGRGRILAIQRGHRALWADFRKADIIGARAADFRPAVIGLRASDKRDVHRYNSRSFARLTKANILTDLTALSKVPPAEFTPKHQQEYNRLQKVNRDIRFEVRQSVRHVYRGAQQFSPERRRTLQIRQL